MYTIGHPPFTLIIKLSRPFPAIISLLVWIFFFLIVTNFCHPHFFAYSFFVIKLYAFEEHQLFFVEERQCDKVCYFLNKKQSDKNDILRNLKFAHFFFSLKMCTSAISCRFCVIIMSIVQILKEFMKALLSSAAMRRRAPKMCIFVSFIFRISFFFGGGGHSGADWKILCNQLLMTLGPSNTILLNVHF